MKKLFFYCFDKWWRPIFFYILIAGLVIVDNQLETHIPEEVLVFFTKASVIILLISLCYQLSKKRFAEGLFNVIILALTGLVLDVSALADGDHQADDLKIPPGIQIDAPVYKSHYDRLIDLFKPKKVQTDLVLYHSSQPGIYEYDFYIEKIESGTLHLKAFEITHNDELSAENLKKQTTIDIRNPHESFTRFSSIGSFKIHEGDWGKFYAARFEVWFQPSSGGQERKLFQKNFKIEGWMF